MRGQSSRPIPVEAALGLSHFGLVGSRTRQALSCHKSCNYRPGQSTICQPCQRLGTSEQGSGWQIANHWNLSARDDFRASRKLGVTILPISEPDIIAAATLPPHHLDPFDRMLIAQAQANSLILVTTDSDIFAYDVRTL